MSSTQHTEIPNEEQQTKKKLDTPLICFCVINFFLNAGVSVIAPFYPPLAKDAGLSVSMIGYIFSFNPIGSCFFSIIMGKKMSHWGRKKCMVVGLFLQSFAIVMFGVLEHLVEYRGWFLGISFATRFLQGASRAAYGSISFAYIPILWPESIQQKISLLESLTGLGLMSGPFVGAALDYFLGYQEIFYVLGGLFFLAIIPTMIMLPEDNHEFAQKSLISMKLVFSSRWVISLGILMTMMSAGTTFISPIFSIHMRSYNLTESQSSLLLGWLTISYIGFINLVPKLTKIIDKRIILTIGLISCAIGGLIIAPLNVFPNEWYMTMIGFPLIGIANALCVLPCIPQFIDYLTQLTKDPTLKTAISDISSGLFFAFYSLGTFVGPVLGGVLYDAFLDGDESIESELHSFKWSSQIIAALQCLAAIGYFFIGDAYKAMFPSKKTKVDPLMQSLQPQEEETPDQNIIQASIRTEKEYNTSDL